MYVFHSSLSTRNSAREKLNVPPKGSRVVTFVELCCAREIGGQFGRKRYADETAGEIENEVVELLLVNTENR